MSESLEREILLEVRDDVKELGNSLGELRLEVATSTATKADLAKVADKADDGIRRLWNEGVNPLDARVAKLERSAVNVVAGWMRAGALKLLVPVAISVAVGAMLTWLKLRGCGG